MRVVRETADLPIRLVASADVPSVIDHVRRTLAEFGIEFGMGSATDAELYGLPDSYARHGGAFWVTRDAAGKVVGTAGVFPVGGGDFELRKKYVSPATRGKRLGRALLDECIAFVREHGGRRVVLDTVEQMSAAIAFYERHGFVRDDRQIRGSRCTRGYALDVGRP